MLYFRVATASLYDGYQPGIEHARTLVSPGLLLALLVCSALVSRSVLVSRIALHTSLCALVICFYVFIGVSLHGGNQNPSVFAKDRTLTSTVHTALFSPNFSGRSKGSIISSAVFALGALAVVLFVRRKRQLTKEPTRLGRSWL